ncbi:Ig-like domain-containing protein [Ideonella paludis]|uniref:Ig-like domain-containing protein n=1 Tax=Ideonella paludis TaxID=1233411 RepID=UPI00363D2F27
MTLDVGGVNDAPVAQADVGSTTEDAILTVSAANGVIQSGAAPAGRDSDVDGDSLAVSAVSFGNTVGKVGSPIAGAFGTLTLNADGSYSYVPNAAAQALDTGESDRDIFTYTVTDPAGKTATTTLTITVTGVNDGPVAIDDSALTPVGTPVTIPVLGNDTDPDGEPLTVTQVDGKPISPGNPVSLTDPVGNPIGTVALNPDGTLTFTPAPGYEGPVDFPYTVTDGTTTDTGNVHVVVSSTNRPPVADDNYVQGIEGTPVTFDPRSNDYDPDTDPIAITQINGKPIAVGSPITLPEGTVALNPDGTLTFTPAKNFDGPVTFEYTIADGRSGTDTAKVVINVAPLDNSPAANDDVATTPEDTPVLVDVLANDKDLDGEKLTITEIDGQPAVVGTPVTITDDQGTPIATVTLTPEGKLNVVPAPNYNGPIEFPYTVTDGDTPVEATVTVNVTPVNDAPVANDDKATVPGDTPTTLDVLGNDTDPDKDPLTISEINGQPVTPGTPVELIDPVTKQPVGTVTVTPEGKITFNPAPGTEGPVTFEYTVKGPPVRPTRPP